MKSLLRVVERALSKSKLSSRAKTKKSPRPVRRCHRVELLESRQMMDASMFGVVSSSGHWEFDLTRTGGVDADRDFGLTNDQFVVGKWNRTSDQPGVARVAGQYLHWYLNTDADVSPVHEVDFLYGLAGDQAVAGDWNGDGMTDAGVVRVNGNGLRWMMDLNRDPNPERTQDFGLMGDTPVVGDWDNNGTANPGVVRNENGFLTWHMDVTGDQFPEVSRIFGLVGDRPIVGDWNDDGRVDIGVARQIPGSQEYRLLLDINGDTQPDMPEFTVNASNSSRFVTGRFKLAEVSVTEATSLNRVEIVDGSQQPINFGKVLVQGSTPVRTIVITNRGNQPLTLSEYSLPNGFEFSTVVPNVINPQSSVSVGIRMKTAVPGNYSGDVNFRVNDGNESPFNFAIAGVVEAIRPEIRVSGLTTFGSVVAGTSGPSIERTFYIDNPGNSPLSYSASLSNVDFVVVSGAAGIVPSGDRKSLVVRMNTNSSGAKSAVLSFTSNAANAASLKLNLSGTVEAAQPKISVTGNLSFGTVAQNSTDANTLRSLTIRNVGNSVLNYTSAVSNSSFSIVAGATASVAPGMQTTMTIRINTSKIGSLSATLTINSNSTVSPTLRVAQSGHVVSLPIVGVSGSGAFGKVERGTIQYREFTISNTGTSTLTYSAGISGAGFSIASGGQASIQSGGTAKLVIRLDTTVAGSRVAELRINSNDSLRPLAIVNLSATVVEPELNVSVAGELLSPGQTGLLYYAASSDTVRTRILQIRNSGLGVLRVSDVQITGVDFSHNLPTAFEIPAGQSREFTVTLQSNLIGTKVGRLSFVTNDSDESQVKINLLGRVLEPVRIVSGNVNRHLEHGTFHIYPNNRLPIYVDPSWGNTAMNGVYAISNNGTKDTFNGELHTIIIHSDRRPDVQNWTNINIIWQNGERQETIPSVRSRLDLFVGL